MQEERKVSGVINSENVEGFLLFPESDTMSSRSPVTYTRSPTTHDKDDPVVIKVPAFTCLAVVLDVIVVLGVVDF